MLDRCWCSASGAVEAVVGFEVVEDAFHSVVVAETGQMVGPAVWAWMPRSIPELPFPSICALGYDFLDCRCLLLVES